jgi:hypothetical protein
VQPRTLNGKRSVFTIVLLLVVVFTFAVPTVSAQPSRLVGAALAQTRVHVTRVGNVTHITLPAQINCAGKRTFWFQVLSSRDVEANGDVVLQAVVNVQLDYYSSSYCGYEFTGAPDRLIRNCYTFFWWTYNAWTNQNVSAGHELHCTAMLYNFKGAIVGTECPTSTDAWLTAHTLVDNNFQTDTTVTLSCLSM